MSDAFETIATVAEGDDGEALRVVGGPLIVKVPAARTGGRFSILEERMTQSEPLPGATGSSVRPPVVRRRAGVRHTAGVKTTDGRGRFANTVVGPPMKVVCCPDKLRGSLTAAEAAAALAEGARRAGSAPVEIPLADGGEGTLDVLSPP